MAEDEIAKSALECLKIKLETEKAEAESLGEAVKLVSELAKNIPAVLAMLLNQDKEESGRN